MLTTVSHLGLITLPCKQCTSYFDAEFGYVKYYLMSRGKYEICNPNKSASAAAMYYVVKFQKFPECINPCTEMKVATHFKYKSQSDHQGDKWVKIIFPTDVEFSVETVTKSLFSTSKIPKQ